MNSGSFKLITFKTLRNWWCSILLLPFVIYSLNQAYWALHYNIFFAILYDFPFPVNIVHLFVTNFLLTIHEAGHTFFSIFGWRTLTILGGSLWEILLPLIILAFYWWKHKKIGIQLSGYLMGAGLLHVAYYVADARRRQLPLIGALPKSAHDWNNLLSRWHALGWDDSIACVLALIAALIFLIALLLPAFFQSYRSADIDLNI